MTSPARRIDPSNAWQCQTCGREHPIKPLARDCEAKHKTQQTQPDEEA